MTKSAEIKNLADALNKFQAEMTAVKETAENPFFKSSYADLKSIIEHVRPILARHGLSFSQFPTGTHGLTTILMHTSGEWIEDTFILKPVDEKPQSVGSAITYARRYALGAILGIATEEDDDGHEASKPHLPAPSGGPVPVPQKVVAAAKTAPEIYAPCDNVTCKNQAKTRFGKLCFTCDKAVKGGAVIKTLRSEGAVEAPAAAPATEEIDVADIPF